jgi:hypothetical protein
MQQKNESDNQIRVGSYKGVEWLFGASGNKAPLPDNESLAVPCPEVKILPPAIYSGLGRKPIKAEAVGGKTVAM